MVLEEVIKARDIYEFDLKNFFESVNIDAISNKLSEWKVPAYIIRKLHIINASAVTLKGERKLNEFESNYKKMILSGKMEDRPTPLSYAHRMRGVPQGAPTSPLLATIILPGSIIDRHIYGLKTVMYADDGLYYGDISNEPITPNSGMVTCNIKFNLSKSG